MAKGELLSICTLRISRITPVSKCEIKKLLTLLKYIDRLTWHKVQILERKWFWLRYLSNFHGWIDSKKSRRKKKSNMFVGAVSGFKVVNCITSCKVNCLCLILTLPTLAF